MAHIFFLVYYVHKNKTNILATFHWHWSHQMTIYGQFAFFGPYNLGTEVGLVKA